MKTTTLQDNQNEQDIWLRAEPIVTDTDILVPVHAYYRVGTTVLYRPIMTKDIFVKAYEQWILGESDDKDE